MAWNRIGKHGDDGELAGSGGHHDFRVPGFRHCLGHRSMACRDAHEIIGYAGPTRSGVIFHESFSAEIHCASAK
jgi:hypothetical protein